MSMSLGGPPSPIVRRSVASIPSRFDTILTRPPELDGFNRRGDRFDNRVSDVPGPGSYGSLPSPIVRTTSVSSKGFCIYSSAPRITDIPLDKKLLPGPGDYNLPTMTLDPRKCKPSPAWEAWKRETKTRGEYAFGAKEGPGPGEYEAMEVRSTPRRYRKKATAAFASHTRRDSFLVHPEVLKNPNFTEYHPERADKLVEKQQNLFVASFKSKGERFSSYATDVPGPLTYEEVREGALSKKGGASFGAIGDRFKPGQSFIPLSTTPGPSAYAPEITCSALDRIKTAPLSRRNGRWDMEIARIAAGPGSSMKSPVPRGEMISRDKAELPGPAEYFPQVPRARSSHHLNASLSFVP